MPAGRVSNFQCHDKKSMKNILPQLPLGQEARIATSNKQTIVVNERGRKRDGKWKGNKQKMPNWNTEKQVESTSRIKNKSEVN